LVAWADFGRSDELFGLVNLSGLLDDAKSFALVRQHRWPEGVRCPV